MSNKTYEQASENERNIGERERENVCVCVCVRERDRGDLEGRNEFVDQFEEFAALEILVRGLYERDELMIEEHKHVN
jgi:hypothetical protein